MPDSPLIKANCIPRLPSSLKLKDFDGSVTLVSTFSWLVLIDSVCMVILDSSVNLTYTEIKPVQKQVMSHLPQNLCLVSFGELTKTKSQNPTQGRQLKAEGNRQRGIRTLMQFLWTIFSVFVGKWILCFTSKVYMKNIVLDLWDDSSRIEFKEEYSNLMEEVKGVLNLTQLFWYGKNNKSKM